VGIGLKRGAQPIKMFREGKLKEKGKHSGGITKKRIQGKKGFSSCKKKKRGQSFPKLNNAQITSRMQKRHNDEGGAEKKTVTFLARKMKGTRKEKGATPSTDKTFDEGGEKVTSLRKKDRTLKVPKGYGEFDHEE